MAHTSPSASPTQMPTRMPAQPPAQSGNQRFAARDRRAEELFLTLAETRDPDARDRLVNELVTMHLALCDGLASRYAGRRIPLDDLVQVARLALVVAIDRYRPGPDSSFVSYALPTISGELKRHFRDHGWMIRPPRRLQELGPMLRRTREEWEQQHGAEPTPSDLATEIGVETQQVSECLASESSYHPLSIDLTFEGTDGRPLADSLASPDKDLDAVIDRVSLRDALGQLRPAERELIHMRFEEGLTQKAIGAQLGVSQMQVSRLVRGVLGRLRELMDVQPAPLSDRLAG